MRDGPITPIVPSGRSSGGGNAASFQQIHDALVGSDLFAMEQHLKRGLLNWGGIEEAMWDAIGKVAGVAEVSVVLTDDVASAPKERAADRRGVAGMLFAFKCAGAAAERGDSLDEVARLCGKANASCRTMGVGLTACTPPAKGSDESIIQVKRVEVKELPPTK